MLPFGRAAVTPKRRVARRRAMRSTAIALVLLVAFTGVVATAPAAEAAPPNLPPGSGCGFFHWHNGDVVEGELPGYHYHHCF